MPGKLRLVEFICAFALALTASLSSQASTEFFNGRTISYIIATSPGGGFDGYGRLVAQYMEKQLPGATIVVRNMPGAGHLIGANAIYAAKPDGLTIGTFNISVMYSQVTGARAAKFDLGKMSWIGKAAADLTMLIVSAQRGDLKAGMHCEISYKPGGDNESASVLCQ